MSILPQPGPLAFVRCYLCDSLVSCNQSVCHYCVSRIMQDPAHLAWQDILLRPDAQKMLNLTNISQLYCLHLYQPPFNFLIPEVKYQASTLAKACLKKIILNEPAALGPFDCLAPVPMHWWRYCLRGFNQADWLARILQKFEPLPVINSGQRVRFTPAQAKLTARQRAKNLTHAFALKSNDEIYRKKVLIVDDVVTTGATLEAYAEVLLNAGAADVSVACICWAKLN